MFKLKLSKTSLREEHEKGRELNFVENASLGSLCSAHRKINKNAPTVD